MPFINKLLNLLISEKYENYMEINCIYCIIKLGLFMINSGAISFQLESIYRK